MENKNQAVLHRCVACGEVSDQVAQHYSRMLCNGCRAFFKRTVQSGGKVVTECKEGGTCIVDPSSRKACKACRFQACLDAGVDPSKVQHPKENNSQETNANNAESALLLPLPPNIPHQHFVQPPQYPGAYHTQALPSVSSLLLPSPRELPPRLPIPQQLPGISPVINVHPPFLGTEQFQNHIASLNNADFSKPVFPQGLVNDNRVLPFPQNRLGDTQLPLYQPPLMLTASNHQLAVTAPRGQMHDLPQASTMNAHQSAFSNFVGAVPNRQINAGPNLPVQDINVLYYNNKLLGQNAISTPSSVLYQGFPLTNPSFSWIPPAPTHTVTSSQLLQSASAAHTNAMIFKPIPVQLNGSSSGVKQEMPDYPTQQSKKSRAFMIDKLLKPDMGETELKEKCKTGATTKVESDQQSVVNYNGLPCTPSTSSTEADPGLDDTLEEIDVTTIWGKDTRSSLEMAGDDKNATKTNHDVQCAAVGDKKREKEKVDVEEDPCGTEIRDHVEMKVDLHKTDTLEMPKSEKVEMKGQENAEIVPSRSTVGDAVQAGMDKTIDLKTDENSQEQTWSAGDNKTGIDKKVDLRQTKASAEDDSQREKSVEIISLDISNTQSSSVEVNSKTSESCSSQHEETFKSVDPNLPGMQHDEDRPASVDQDKDFKDAMAETAGTDEHGEDNTDLAERQNVQEMSVFSSEELSTGNLLRQTAEVLLEDQAVMTSLSSDTISTDSGLGNSNNSLSPAGRENSQSSSLQDSAGDGSDKEKDVQNGQGADKSKVGLFRKETNSEDQINNISDAPVNDTSMATVGSESNNIESVLDVGSGDVLEKVDRHSVKDKTNDEDQEKCADEISSKANHLTQPHLKEQVSQNGKENTCSPNRKKRASDTSNQTKLTPKKRRRLSLGTISENGQLEQKAVGNGEEDKSVTAQEMEDCVPADFAKSFARRLGTQLTSTPVAQTTTGCAHTDFTRLMCDLARLFRNGLAVSTNSRTHTTHAVSTNSSSHSEASSPETKGEGSESPGTWRDTKKNLKTFQDYLIRKIQYDETYTVQEFKKDVLEYSSLVSVSSVPGELKLDDTFTAE